MDCPPPAGRLSEDSGLSSVDSFMGPPSYLPTPYGTPLSAQGQCGTPRGRVAAYTVACLRGRTLPLRVSAGPLRVIEHPSESVQDPSGAVQHPSGAV